MTEILNYITKIDLQFKALLANVQYHTKGVKDRSLQNFQRNKEILKNMKKIKLQSKQKNARSNPNLWLKTTPQVKTAKVLIILLEPKQDHNCFTTIIMKK